MALVKVISSNFGSGKAIYVMDASEGRHFCNDCRKLIREGERFVDSHMPKPFTRDTAHSYYHEECPLTNTKDTGGE